MNLLLQPDILEVEEDEVDVICPDMISSTTPTVASSTRSVKSVAGTTLSLKDIVRHACLPSKIFVRSSPRHSAVLFQTLFRRMLSFACVLSAKSTLS